MIKAYSSINDLNSKAINILNDNNIELTLNNTSSLPNNEELKIIFQEYDIIIIGVKTIIPKEILTSIKKPKIIATLSVGLDHIAEEVQQSKKVTIINLRKANAISVTEHIFALILALNKRIFESNTLFLNEQGFRKNIQALPKDISHKKLGLIGAGNITQEVIKIAKAFNMEMICYTLHPKLHDELLKYNITFKSLDEVLQESDIINVSIPLTNATKNLISKEKISMIKNTATFINTARLEIVDLKSLIAKADKYPTFNVGLDVEEQNCQNLLSKYRKNVIVTPHIAGISEEAIKRTDEEIANSIVEVLNNKKGSNHDNN